jgi:hypothetical protein
VSTPLGTRFVLVGTARGSEGCQRASCGQGKFSLSLRFRALYRQAAVAIAKKHVENPVKILNPWEPSTMAMHA